jgi:hypothetical protein
MAKMKTVRTTKASWALGFAALVALSSVEVVARGEEPVVPAPAVAPIPPPAPPPTQAAPPPVEPPPPSSGVSRTSVAWGAAGVAAAGAIGAAVFGILALNDKSSYQQRPTFSNTDDGNSLAAYADGCLFLAAAAGVTSLILFLTNPPANDDGASPAPRKASLVPSPVVTTRGGGVGAVLQF